MPARIPTLSTWTAVVTNFLGATTREEVVRVGGKKEVITRHATDPGHDYLPTGPRDPSYGPLPPLVAEADARAAAKKETHEHSLPLPVLAEHLEHMAHVVVKEARRNHARGFALQEPRLEDGSCVLGVVLVLA